MSTSPPAHPDLFSPKFGERPPVVTRGRRGFPTRQGWCWVFAGCAVMLTATILLAVTL